MLNLGGFWGCFCWEGAYLGVAGGGEGCWSRVGVSGGVSGGAG